MSGYKIKAHNEQFFKVMNKKNKKTQSEMCIIRQLIRLTGQLTFPLNWWKVGEKSS